MKNFIKSNSVFNLGFAEFSSDVMPYNTQSYLTLPSCFLVCMCLPFTKLRENAVFYK